MCEYFHKFLDRKITLGKRERVAEGSEEMYTWERTSEETQGVVGSAFNSRSVTSEALRH